LNVLDRLHHIGPEGLPTKFPIEILFRSGLRDGPKVLQYLLEIMADKVRQTVITELTKGNPKTTQGRNRPSKGYKLRANHHQLIVRARSKITCTSTRLIRWQKVATVAFTRARRVEVVAVARSSSV
jgi:hypothetical protein